MKCAIIIVFLLYSLNYLLAFDTCPPLDNKHECTCSNETNFTSYECHLSLPDLENYHFEFCEFNNVTSSMVNWKNVTCKFLRIEGKSSEYNDLALIKNLNFNELQLIHITNSLLNRIFEIKSTLVQKIDILHLDYIEKFDLKFGNFPNTQIINTDFSFFSPMKTICSNIFSKLKFIKEINLGRSNISFLDDKSLVFSSNEVVKLKLYNNKITIDELTKSGLWNDMGMEIDAHKNNIDKLPESFFKKFCDGHEFAGEFIRFSIDLGENPIICDYDEIKWILKYKYEDRTDSYFPLKNVACANLENRLLLFMVESDFNILSNRTSSNNPDIQIWPFILGSFGILIMVVLIIVIPYMLIRKCSSINKGSLFSNDINFNKKYKVLSELGSGGFGSVFKVMDNRTKITSAIKKIHLKGII